jgi:alkylation response protein AidB-like acyl-CoA dehydrogenase
MDFTFSDEQRMAAETVRGLLADRCAAADLRRLLAHDCAFEAARWQALAELGLAGLMVPEARGGLGLAEPDLVLIAEACGYAGLPEPLVEHAGVAAPLLAALGAPAADAWAERAGTGEALALLHHPANPYLAHAAEAAVLLAVHDGALFLVERGAASLTPRRSVDPLRPLAAMAFDPAAATRVAAAADAAPLLAQALDRGALFAAAQGLGLAQRLADLAAAYARERQQFGRPIGANQAVKHHLATVQVKIEFARPVVYAAAAQIGQQDLFSRARISHAKLAALAAADLAGRTAIQVFGAMGYSWETDLHLFLKRALALSGLWGDEAFHRARVAERALAAPLTPDQTFARADDARCERSAA